jgi:hypothetical protein
MNKQTFEIGELLIRIKTGKTAVILESRASGRQTYGRGSTDDRRLYKVFEDGRSYWKHDLQLAAEYHRASLQEPL